MVKYIMCFFVTIKNPIKARKYERTTLERKLKKVEYDSDDSDDLSIKNKKLEKKLKKYKAKLDKK